MSGLWDLKDIVNSRQNRSKNKLVSENSVTPAHENCSLRVPGGRGRWVLFSHRNWADSHDTADFALGCKTVGSFLKIGLVYVKSLNTKKNTLFDFHTGFVLTRGFKNVVELSKIWCPSGWAAAWRLHTNLYKFG